MTSSLTNLQLQINYIVEKFFKQNNNQKNLPRTGQMAQRIKMLTAKPDN